MRCTTTVTGVIGAGTDGSADLPWFQLRIEFQFEAPRRVGASLALAAVLPAVGLASTFVGDCAWNPCNRYGLRGIRMVDGAECVTGGQMGPIWAASLRLDGALPGSTAASSACKRPRSSSAEAALAADTDGGSEDTDRGSDDADDADIVAESNAEWAAHWAKLASPSV
jgi:hypothetical protein